MINKIFHFLKFQEFINELEKICFLLEIKWDFQPSERPWLNSHPLSLNVDYANIFSNRWP